MEIRNISISDFYNIQQFDISLTDFNALVAPNDCGKSNVLEGNSARRTFLSVVSCVLD